MKPRASAKGSQHDTGLRLLSYARVSDVRGREGPGFISPTDQLARNRAYADAYGHAIIEEDVDLDRSGGDMSRPVFDRFLAQIGSGDADGLIVAKLDRFARSNRGALEAIEEIEAAGGTLISVAEQIDPRSASGRFMRSIFLATAQMERERIGEQWHVARSSAVDRGIHVSHHVPPGYTRGKRTNDPGTDRRLSPHRTHAKTIRDAFAMAASGATDSEIAAHLNARKLPTFSVKHGEKPTHWQSFRVRRLLENRVYLGEARSGAGIVNGDAHEPLVDADTFTLAQSRYTNPRRAPSSGSSLLSGLVRCASCSFSMKSQPGYNGAPGVYRCVTTSVHGRCSAPSSISKDRFERYVIEEFVATFDEVFVGDTAPVREDVRELVADVRRAEQSYRAALGNVDLRRQIGDADHDAHVAALHREWRERQTRLDESRTDAPVDLPAGMTAREYVDSLDRDELRGLLGRGIEAVFVRPAASRARNLPVENRVRVVWRGEDVDLPRRGERFEPRAFTW